MRFRFFFACLTSTVLLCLLGCSDVPPTSATSEEIELDPSADLNRRYTADDLAGFIRDRDLTAMRTALAGGLDPDLPGSTYLPPLHIAAELGYRAEGELLLDSGADANKVCVIPVANFAGKTTWKPLTTPLHLAVQNGHVDFVLLLLERGADANVQNGYGATPLDVAGVIADQAQNREEDLTESLTLITDEDRLVTLREMLANTSELRVHLTRVIAVLGHHGGKTRADLEAQRVLDHAEEDTTLEDAARLVQQSREDRERRKRELAAQVERAKAASQGESNDAVEPIERLP
ncbi:MAG: ankyrin repeat domain-containing protein [Planctomycetota bacterium]|nr:MAG: ankyrin repeat domain-containing protein [Planctomycetota bacterium]REJ91374.1 MAG: ankyrin repeat domain-containing protein [Planctomycetota bacterium]REK18506.1 MAG: ankyrin repeat domain-containing protein [Planctomycetota bacterium]REK39434.1 MAG: ankyrin repeat domain-containing protein [Planctomycetota bacterium]